MVSLLAAVLLGACMWVVSRRLISGEAFGSRFANGRLRVRLSSRRAPAAEVFKSGFPRPVRP